MRLLLDSHVVLWAISEPERLTDLVKSLVEDPASELIVSHAAIWEILNKANRGGIPLLAGTPLAEVFAQIESLGVTLLPVTLDHILVAAGLPDIHRDPFDRMFVAQALAEGIPLVTIDERIWQYPVPTIWH